MNIPFRTGIREWLLALTLLTLLPLFSFSAYTIYRLAQERQAAIHIELRQRSEAAANAVNERLGTTLGYLNSLATSEAAINNDLFTLHRHAQRIVALNPEATAITLVSSDGQLLFNTLRPFGSPSVAAAYPETVKIVFETAKPVVSGPFVGPASKLPVTSVGVPLFQQGKVAYCLRMVLKIDSLNDLLADQKLPGDWVGTLIDSTGSIVARTRSPEKFVGQPVPAPLMAAIKGGVQGIIDSETKEGIPVKTAVARVPSWDWTIAIGVPKESLNAPLRESLRWLALSGVVVAVLCIGAALAISRTITRRVVSVVMASRAIQRGESVPVPRSAIRELDDMAKALVAIHGRGLEAVEALDEANAIHGQLASELLLARCDALTGLPGRALFVELVEAMRDVAASQSGKRLAVLFIDLDGFKAVNDRYGHDEGDKILVHTATILREQIRDSDAAGRLGGDEFIVCVAAPEEQIEATASSIAGRIVDQVGAIGKDIGCSIGIALWLSECPDVSCAMRRADEAMYEAKRLGKNRFALFDNQPNTAGEPKSATTDAPLSSCGKCIALGRSEA